MPISLFYSNPPVLFEALLGILMVIFFISRQKEFGSLRRINKKTEGGITAMEIIGVLAVVYLIWYFLEHQK